MRELRSFYLKNSLKSKYENNSEILKQGEKSFQLIIIKEGSYLLSKKVEDESEKYAV